jgi:hypothetical protein
MKLLSRVIVALLFACSGASAAEISTNGTGGGAWSDPATWRGKAVPGPKDDVVIQKFDIVNFDKNDDGKISCNKLQIDPRGALMFKTGAGKQVCCIADAIDSFGVIKLDGTKSATDFLELRMVGDTAEKRKIKLNKGAAFLLYGKANLPEDKRNVALSAPKIGEQKDDIISLVAADGFVSFDWQRSVILNVRLQAQKIDNTGAKANERLNIFENQFVGLSRIWFHTCDSPVIVKNTFDYKEKAALTEAAIAVYYGPLAEIRGNTVRGAFQSGITIGYQSDTVIEGNTIEKCGSGITGGYGIPNTMVKKCVIRGCETGIKFEGGSGVIEDTLVEGATMAFHQQNMILHLTNFQIKDLNPKGVAVFHEGGRLSLLNCNITPAQIKLAPPAATAKDDPVTSLQYAIVRVKDAPANALVELRTVDPKLAADAADPNVRNSPAPLTAGLSPLPKSLNPLIVKAWTMDLKGKLPPTPEYNVKVLGPAPKEGAARPLLKMLTFRPAENAFRALPDDVTPTLEISLK